MEGKLCPYCMHTTFGDFCKNCKKKVDYQEKPMQLPVGTELQGYHHYIVGAALGQGGFGVTYLALDTDNNKRVALKEFYPVHCSGRTKDTTVMAFDGQDEDFEKGKQRFLLEAQTMQRLARVQSVVEVYDCFQANNTVYLVMEYVEGQSLKKYLEENGPVEPQKFFAMMRPLLEDIALMHRQGVIHRDIAPDNIILDTNGKLRLIDFGTAREYMGQASMTVVVKKGFAPVEQYTRRGQSAATDVYALAATMYYCITGHVVPDSMDRIEEDTLKGPSEWGVKLPQNQEDALIHALGVRVKDRTQTVDAFLAELLPEPPKPKPLPKPEPKPEPKKEPKQEPKQEQKPAPKPDSKPAPKQERKQERQSPSGTNRNPLWMGAAAAVLVMVILLFAFGGKKEAPTASLDAPETRDMSLTAPTEAAHTEPETVPETEPPKETVPMRNTADFAYAYSDDPADNSCYTAEEFAEIVNYDAVRDYLPIGTKIKMVPNSEEITDESIEFELVSYKHFRLADGKDFAKTTWLAVNLLNEPRQMNSEWTNRGGWPNSELREWLNETLYPTLPEYWKELMQEVRVRSTAGEGATKTVSSNDRLFIPSLGEVDAFRADYRGYKAEIDGTAEEQTFSIFTHNAFRVKARMGNDTWCWWLRSPNSSRVGSSGNFAYVNGIGNSYNSGIGAYISYGVCPGFCLGVGGESAVVQDAVSYDYAYSDDPVDNARYTAEEFAKIVKSENVRELLPLGTKIKMAPNSEEITDEAIEFELVAYKHFRLADGEDFAKTTWLAVNLLNEERQMNSEWTNRGGWAKSELREWLNETLYPTLPEYWKGLMQEVQVCSTAGNGSLAIVSSDDRLFIPSLREIGYDFSEKNGYKNEVDGAAEEESFFDFTDGFSRRKANYGVATWWLRSPWAGSSTYFAIVDNVDGYSGYTGAGSRFGVCPGFCI